MSYYWFTGIDQYADQLLISFLQWDTVHSCFLWTFQNKMVLVELLTSVSLILMLIISYDAALFSH